MVGLVGAGQARMPILLKLLSHKNVPSFCKVARLQGLAVFEIDTFSSCGAVEVSVKYAIPIIMGANIGTSVTNTIAGRSGLHRTVSKFGVRLRENHDPLGEVCM